MPKKQNKKYLISEAFPPNKKGYREKIYPLSLSHIVLEGTTINPEEIIYKPLTKENIEEIKNLHKEWFPINYSDKFFIDIFDKKKFWYFTVGAFYNFFDEEKNEKKEIIVGLALCEWIPISEYFINHTSKEAIKEISKNISYKEEIKSYLKCEDYKCAYIMTIGVVDELRKKNIGTSILNQILDKALTESLCVGVLLDVIYYNYSAIKFYKKNNFKKVSTIKNYYTLNGTKYDSNVFLRIFTKKEKDDFNQKNRNIIQKIINVFLDLFSVIIKFILFIVLFQCFRNKIKTK